MKIIYETRFNDSDALRLFTSNAKPRENLLRIHYHASIEISLIMSGNGKYRTNDAVYEIQAGDVFFFRPNEAHCITDIEQGGMELLNLHIAPYYLYKNLQNALSSDYTKILNSNFSLKSNKINDTVSTEQIQEIRRLFLSVRKEFEEKKGDFESFACNCISSILILFSRAYEIAGLPKEKRHNYQKLLCAIKYIDENYKENITLDMIAQQVAYSKCYFSSMFKKCMGMSVWDYIGIKRIEESLFLIKTTEKNITDIALECGFNNVVNFNKLFKKYTNVSPSYFRKQ